MALHKKRNIMKRVLLSLLILILSFTFVSMAATVIFFHTAFPRSDTLPAYSLSYEDIDENAYPAEKIRFLSGENTLTGYCYAAESPKALVVIAAGFRESGAAFLTEMMTFVDSGYSVFCYDATGIGESEGDGTIGLSQPSLDLRAALDAVSSDNSLSSLPILLYGHSAGGYAAAVCADDPRVKAAVILSGFESPTLLMRETARGYVGVLADIEYPFILLENTLVFSSDANRSASSCILSADIPIAVYEGANDGAVPPSARLSDRLGTDCEDVTVQIYSQGSHSDYWLSDEAIAVRESGSDDHFAANEMDPGFRDSILLFYSEALSES